MKNESEFIPFSDISNEFPIAIATPPPHRNKLAVHRPTLDNALRTLNAQDDAITMYFFRDEPKINVAPKGNDHVEALTGEVYAQPENEKRPAAVSYNPESETILMHIPYHDNKTTTITGTARSLSSKLKHTFGHIPGAKYPHSESFQVLPIVGEWGPPVVNAFWGFMATLPFAGVTAVLEKSAFHQQIGFWHIYAYLALNVYLGKMILDLMDVWDYRHGRISASDRLYNKVTILSQDPRRAIYPATYMHEVLVPGIVYNLQSLTAPDVLAEAPWTNRSE